jgi:molybdopterin converting factor small subunit
MTTLRLASVLRQTAPDLHQREFAGFDGTLDQFLEQVCAEGGPALRERLFDGTKLRRYLNVYVDGVDVRFAHRLATRVGPDSAVDLIPAVAGG